MCNRVTYTNGDAHVIIELESPARLSVIKLKNYCSKKYSLYYKSVNDEEKDEWKCIRPWTSQEWNTEFDIKFGEDEEPIIAKQIKFMVSDGSYSSWKMVNIYGYKMFA